MEKVFVFCRRKEPWPNSISGNVLWVSNDGMSLILSFFLIDYKLWRNEIIHNFDYTALSEIQLIKPKIKHSFKPTY